MIIELVKWPKWNQVKKMLNVKHIFAICLLIFASSQTAQAKVLFSSVKTVAGSLGSPESFTKFDGFKVKVGNTYLTTLTDLGTVASPTVDNFDALSLVILDDSFSQVGTSLALAPLSSSGKTSISFSFTTLYDSTFYISLGGITDALSTYAATIISTDASPVPVPATVWFFGSAILTLVGFRQRKTV